jgi:hypothetical protein
VHSHALRQQVLSPTTFTQNNLISDGSAQAGPARQTDPNLINPWGVAYSVQVLDNKLFVTFALQDSAAHDDVAGPGIPGNNGSAGNSSTIYFTAIVQDEMHGLFGGLTANQTPSPTATTGTGSHHMTG